MNGKVPAFRALGAVVALCAALAAAPHRASATHAVLRARGGDLVDAVSLLLASVSPPDTVYLESGTYHEQILVTQESLTLIGLGSGVILDGSQHDGAIVQADGDRSRALVVQNLTFRNGTGGQANTRPGGGAIAWWDPTCEGTLRVERCTFERNHAGDVGGAIAADQMQWMVVEDCAFRENTARVGGSIYFQGCGPLGSARVERSSFIVPRSEADEEGRAVTLLTYGCPEPGCGGVMRDCVVVGSGGSACGPGVSIVGSPIQFEGNRVAGECDARVELVQFDGVRGPMRSSYAVRDNVIAGRSGSTFPLLDVNGDGQIAVTGNTVVGGALALVAVGEAGSAVERNLVVGGSMLGYLRGQGVIRCNNVWQGEWSLDALENTTAENNVGVDPLFCDPGGGDYSLCCGSPCQDGATPGCGQIGALGSGCPQVPVERATWGSVKWRFVARSRTRAQ